MVMGTLGHAAKYADYCYRESHLSARAATQDSVGPAERIKRAALTDFEASKERTKPENNIIGKYHDHRNTKFKRPFDSRF